MIVSWLTQRKRYVWMCLNHAAHRAAVMAPLQVWLVAFEQLNHTRR